MGGMERMVNRLVHDLFPLNQIRRILEGEGNHFDPPFLKGMLKDMFQQALDFYMAQTFLNGLILRGATRPLAFFSINRYSITPIQNGSPKGAF
ncbi:MAG: hypothetical protein LBK73_01820 [Treponema sp.]|jgi:hypothetical protein|nr:hypothetical protein [Treponema sp.]